MPVWMDAYAAAPASTGDLELGPPRPARRRSTRSSSSASARSRTSSRSRSRRSRTSPRSATCSSPRASASSCSRRSCARPPRRSGRSTRRARTRLLGVAGPPASAHPAPDPGRPGGDDPGQHRPQPGLEESAALERPLLLGSSGAGLAAPDLSRSPRGTLGARHRRTAGATAVGVGRPRRSTLAGSAATRTSASRSTARSRRSGSASSSACSATGSTRSRSSTSCSRSRSRRSTVALMFVASTPPEPAVLAGRGRPRRSLGPEAGPRGVGHPPGGAGAPRPGRDLDQRLARLPDRVPDHDRVDLLPAGPDRDPAAHRRRRATCSRPTPRCGWARRSRTSSTTRSPACSCCSSAARVAARVLVRRA